MGKKVNSENRIQKRVARTKCRSFPQSDFFLSSSLSTLYQFSHPNSPGDNRSVSSGRSSGPMVPEFDFSSDSDDDLEILFPSAGLFSKNEPDEASNLKLKTMDGKVVEISSSAASSAPSSGVLLPEIDLSSDSEDDLEIIARKLFMPNKEAFTLPKITESKLDKEIQGKKYFKIIYRQTSNRWLREWIGLFYTTYLDLYKHCKNRLSLLSYIFWLYGLASYFSALCVHFLDLLSNTWRLTLRYVLRIILKSDQITTKVLNDRQNLSEELFGEKS